jgi:hypothetical protein
VHDVLQARGVQLHVVHHLAAHQALQAIIGIGELIELEQGGHLVVGDDQRQRRLVLHVLASHVVGAEDAAGFDELLKVHIAVRSTQRNAYFLAGGQGNRGAAGLAGCHRSAERIDQGLVAVTAGSGELEAHDLRVRRTDATQLHGFAAVQNVGRVLEVHIQVTEFDIDVVRVGITEAGGDLAGGDGRQLLVAFAFAVDDLGVNDALKARAELLDA